MKLQESQLVLAHFSPAFIRAGPPVGVYMDHSILSTHYKSSYQSLRCTQWDGLFKFKMKFTGCHAILRNMQECCTEVIHMCNRKV